MAGFAVAMLAGSGASAGAQRMNVLPATIGMQRAVAVDVVGQGQRKVARLTLAQADSAIAFLAAAPPPGREVSLEFTTPDGPVKYTWTADRRSFALRIGPPGAGGTGYGSGPNIAVYRQALIDVRAGR